MKSSFLSSCVLLCALMIFTACGGGGGGTASTSDSDNSSASSSSLGAVTGLTVTAGDSQNSVSWTAVTGASYYNLYWEAASASRSAALVADCSGDSFKGITDTSFTHTGLSNGTTYSYSATAVGEDGTEGECNGESGSATGSPTQATVAGCTDSSANNYNPNATENNGSCTYTVAGCTDSNASNYNPSANSDDGSCTYASSGGGDSGGGGSTPSCPPGTIWDGNGCI